MKKFFIIFSLATSYLLLAAQSAFAHEAYVLTRPQFQEGLATYTKNPLAGLFDTSHLGLTIGITIGVIVAYFLAVFWATTPASDVLDKLIRKAKVVGPLIIRLAISSSFFYAAMANSVLGPELSLTTIAGGEVIRYILFVLSLMIFFGFFVEIAAAVGLVIFFYVTGYFGQYMITYANYFGELVVLLLFGSRTLSLDKYLFGDKLWFKSLRKWTSLETPIVRVLYGVALIYAGWTIKFAHQSLSVAVYNEYHLQNFFHASASFIASGAGLSEILIGLFILLGLTMRLTVLISLFFITISILYFREMLWPHFMLYGISFSLLINSADKFTIDRYLIPWAKKIRKKVLHI